MSEISKQDLNDCTCTFQSFIQSTNHIPTLRENIFKGKLSNPLIRPTVWKIFLDVYPRDINISSWIKSTIGSRAYYKSLMRKYLSVNPNEKEANIKQYFEDDQMKKLIDLDIKRTYQEMTIFHDIITKTIFSNILFIWSKENPDISYRQGLNELLAVLFLSFYPLYFKNRQNVSEEELFKYSANEESIELYLREIYMFLNDENEIQGDLYTIFDQLMKKGGNDMFSLKIAAVNSMFPKSQSAIDTIEMKFNSIKSFFKMSKSDNGEGDDSNKPKEEKDDEKDSDKGKKEDQSFFTSRCSMLIDDKLKALDLSLYEHLIDNDVECRMILQRWMKCLFNREFEVDSVLALWDAIFANEQGDTEQYGFVFIDYIAIAMLLNIRQELLQSDQNDCFVLLYEYPKKDTSELVIIADKVKNAMIKRAKGKYVSLHEIINDKHSNSTEPKKSISNSLSSFFKKESSSSSNSTNHSDNITNNMKSLFNKTEQSLSDFFKKMTDPQFFRMPSTLEPIIENNTTTTKTTNDTIITNTQGDPFNNTISTISTNTSHDSHPHPDNNDPIQLD